MSGAGDIQQKSIRAIKRDKRSEPRTPIGEIRKKPRLFFRRSLDDDKMGMARARIGERKAWGKAKPFGVSIDAKEPLRAFDFDDRDERRLFFFLSPRGVRFSPAQRSRPVRR